MKKLIHKMKYPSANVLASVLNSMDSCLWVSDIQTGEILFMNDRMKEHFHLGDEAEGGVCWELLQSEQGKRCDFCPVYRLVQGDDAPVVWEEYNKVTGRYYRHTDRIIEWSGGKKVHLQNFVDITDIRLAEASLQKRLKQQELMSSISQSFNTTRDMQDVICEALKTAGEFMGMNQAFLSKYQEDEGVLECLYEWYDEDGQPYIGKESRWPISPDMEIYKDLMENGYAAVNDYSLLTHPNFERVRDYDLRAFLNIPVKVSGECWGIIGFIINNQKYEWDESDIHLGKLIAGVFSGAVSRNITENDLFKAKEAAERASKAKGEFLSHMSHEMRTPMNAIIGMTEIARNSGDPQKMEHCLERVDRASKHLLCLINDTLDMSKIEASKLELSPSEFDFERMLMNVTGVVNVRVEEKNQSLIINIDKDVPSAFIGDEMRLSQVIANLLTNAVKFAPEGGTIVLNARNAGIPGEVPALLVEVIDNGIGISEEQQARLFSPFGQADGGIARQYGGTGLGLTISKGIVELMGGRIWIESELGKGSKFSFTVRMEVGRGLPRQELDDTIDKAGARILLVENIPEMRDYFIGVLPEFGLTCDVVDSGLRALEMIRQKKDDPYTVFFIDWTIPDLDSIELAKKIKRVTCDSKVIIMISETGWSSISKNAAAFVDSYLFKPLFPSTLIHSINKSMGAALAQASPQDQSRIYDFQDYTILVADDIEINREIILAVLEDTRISIDFAQDGIEALSMFEGDPGRYNLILMDIQMPDMDGYEATRKIRALEGARAKNVPIIAMTANVFREDIERCLQAGMNDHIGKPINTEELLAKLAGYL